MNSAVLPEIASPEGKTITCGLATGTGEFLKKEAIDPFRGKAREKIPSDVAEGCIPGYKGFIRGSQHFYGSTYGKMSRDSGHHEFGPDSEGNPVDEAPDGISENAGTQYGDALENPKNRLPGYAGYVPGSKFEFASTFGQTTSQLVESQKQALAESPKKPRMLATTTTEMLNGKNAVIIDRTPPLLKQLRDEEKHQCAVHEKEGGNIPGYAGFIRGAQHFYGSTYGSMTRVAKDYEYSKPIVQGRQPTPSAKGEIHGAFPIRPNHNTLSTDKFVDINSLPIDRPPGYSGHVPLAKFEYANTFGHTCESSVAKFGEMHPTHKSSFEHPSFAA